MSGKSHKKKGKFCGKIKLLFGLISGAFLGLLYAPKKGKEFRKYLKSEEFKEKCEDAKGKCEDLSITLSDRIQEAMRRAKGAIGSIRKRFGM